MKTKMLLLLAIASTLFFAACEENSTEKIEKEFDLTGFSEVDLGDAFQIQITQGDSFAIKARGTVRDINDLDLYVSNGVLKGKYEPSGHNRKRTEITIQMPELIHLRLSGATKTTLIGFFNDNAKLDLNVSGASELDANTSWKILNLSVSGASEVNLIGSTQAMYAEVSGASKFYGNNFQTETFATDLSGASKATVSVSQELKGSLTGNSELKYKGNPTTVDLEVSGNSHVSKL